MPNITEFCRELRRRETPAEKILWNVLRGRHLSGYKFLRQYPICIASIQGKISCFIADFYCHKAKLVIEADGEIHLLKQDYDANRDEVLKELGLKTVRFTNEQIKYNLNEVLDTIKSVITEEAKV